MIKFGMLQRGIKLECCLEDSQILANSHMVKQISLSFYRFSTSARK